jgi:hypothetical protein
MNKVMLGHKKYTDRIIIDAMIHQAETYINLHQDAISYATKVLNVIKSFSKTLNEKKANFDY